MGPFSEYWNRRSDMNHKTVIIAGGASLLAAAAGFFAGDWFGVKRANAKFDEELAKQLEAAEQVFKMKYKVGMYGSPVEMAERRVPAGQVTKEQAEAARVAYGKVSDLDEDGLKRIIEGLRKEEVGTPPGGPISGPPMNGHKVETLPTSLLGLGDNGDFDDTQTHHLFGDDEPEQPNYSEYIEENPRTRENPYVITVTEWGTSEHGIDDKVSVFWYDEDEEEGMGVLTDSSDIPIDDIEATVGWDNMSRFGMWSGSSNTVYIRNERLRCDFEVTRHRGSYAAAMGLNNPKKSKRQPARRGADE
jgi:hypothetical protein